ncbi:MAG: acetolactate synthase large subunit [Candidatus Velthaea sp.]
MKYSDLVVEWLIELGYTHCFFVAGGNIMHLLDGVRNRLECVPFVHEVAAGIAAEYFNESRSGKQGRAFVLVTAGPGVTNVITALGGAFLESRELLVLAGQAKSTDLASGGIRQRGIQEIDGVALAAPVCVTAVRITAPISRHMFGEYVMSGRRGRPGPVFLELCLDAQGAPVDRAALEPSNGESAGTLGIVDKRIAVLAHDIAERVRNAERPVLLLGGGVSRAAASEVRAALRSASVAVMTTWNGMDRVDASDPNYGGRPNTWGQRSANILLQQADVIVALGTRLGLQQTGFNYQAFAPLAHVIQVDIDEAELRKGHPHVETPFCGDAGEVLRALMRHDLGDHETWLSFVREVRELLPLADPENTTGPGYLDPFRFNIELAKRCRADDIIVPCSSGGAFTTAMQAFGQTFGQTVITNHGLASMGYGLSAAIGAALRHRDRRVILLEGDGGFTQNLQELATVSVNKLPLKIFIFSNEGYASIRMTQRNYFGGGYLGCDTRTGLGFPSWAALFAAYEIPTFELGAQGLNDTRFAAALNAPGPQAFVVPLDPEQTYFPKISSRMTQSGSMESNPLHLMSPDLAPELARRVMPYLIEDGVKVEA